MFFVFRDSYVLYIYIYIYIWTLYVHFPYSRIWLWYSINWNHHHHVVLPVRTSLTLSRHSSLSFWKVLRATSCILTELLYVGPSWSSCFCSAIWGSHRRTSVMSLSLLLQPCPACLVRLTWIVFVMGGRWPYSWCFVRCCLQDLFKLLTAFLCSCRQWNNKISYLQYSEIVK